MARSKAAPARKLQARDEESLLLRSAESLGRMIGTLQRQLDEATHRLSMSDPAPSPAAAPKLVEPGVRSRRTPVVKPAARKAAGTKRVAARATGRKSTKAPALAVATKRRRKTTKKIA